MSRREKTENVVLRNDAMMMRKAKRNASASMLKPMNKSDFKPNRRNRSESTRVLRKVSAKRISLLFFSSSALAAAAVCATTEMYCYV